MNNSDIFCQNTCPPIVPPADPVIDCYDIGCWGESGSAKKDFENLLLCDVVTATITGTIAWGLAGSEVTFSPSITVTGDSILTYAVDFGNGFTDVGNSPSYNYADEASGHYEIKVYAIFASGNKLMIAAKEFDFDTVTDTFVGIPSSNTVNRSYPLVVASVRQNLEDGVLVSTTDLAGNPYTPQGTLSTHCPERIQEFFQSDDVKNAVGETYPKAIGSGFGCIKTQEGLFTIYSKYSPVGGEHPEYPGSIHYADILASANHTGWFIYYLVSQVNPGQDSNGHTWYPGVLDSNPDYDANDTLNIVSSMPNITGYTVAKVQWVKFQNQDGTIFDKYYELNSSNQLLVEVNFDINSQEFSVGDACEPKLELFEMEVCGTIDGSIETYQLIKIYTRDESGVPTLLRYEDTKGNLITGVVVEKCCDCDAKCEDDAPPLMRVKDYYNVNSDAFLNALGSPNPKEYQYRLLSFVHNGNPLLTNVLSPAWTAPLNTNVATQVAPYNTIPAYNPGTPFPVDYNWINWLNSLGVAGFTFRESPFDDTIDIAPPSAVVAPLPAFPGGNLTYGDGFQIVYPDGDTFDIEIEALYDGWVGHKMRFTESANYIDGLPVAGVPNTGLTF